MAFHNIHSRPFIPLATEPLLMQPIRHEDASGITLLLNNLNISKTTSFIPYPYCLDDAKKFISTNINEMKEGKSTLILSILNRETKQLLGVVDYGTNNNSIGYWLGEPFWGNGYMKEAMNAFVHFLFDSCDIRELDVSVMPSNIRSLKIIKGLGCAIPTFQKEFFSISLQEKHIAQHYKLTQNDYWKKHEMNSVPIIWVSAVAILQDGKLLITERPHGKSLAGLWEFPGGKIEVGETPEKALARELHEELDIIVNPNDCKPVTFASYRYETFHLVMPLFIVLQWDGIISSKENQRFTWIHYHDIIHYPTPGADIKLFHMLYDFVQKEKLWT